MFDAILGGCNVKIIFFLPILAPAKVVVEPLSPTALMVTFSPSLASDGISYYGAWIGGLPEQACRASRQQPYCVLSSLLPAKLCTVDACSYGPDDSCGEIKRLETWTAPQSKIIDAPLNPTFFYIEPHITSAHVNPDNSVVVRFASDSSGDLVFHLNVIGEPPTSVWAYCVSSQYYCMAEGLSPETWYQVSIRACIERFPSTCSQESDPVTVVTPRIPSGKQIHFCKLYIFFTDSWIHKQGRSKNLCDSATNSHNSLCFRPANCLSTDIGSSLLRGQNPGKRRQIVSVF